MNGAAGGDGVGWKRGSLKGVRFPSFLLNSLGKVRYFFLNPLVIVCNCVMVLAAKNLLMKLPS